MSGFGYKSSGFALKSPAGFALKSTGFALKSGAGFGHKWLWTTFAGAGFALKKNRVCAQTKPGLRTNDAGFALNLHK